MNIKEFFVTLFNHRRTLRNIRAEFAACKSACEELCALRDAQDAALGTLSRALVYAVTPPAEEEKPVLKPVRLFRPSYAQQQQMFERAHSARFREMDAERARKAQRTGR